MGTLSLDIFITEQFNQLLVQYPAFMPIISFAAEGLGVITIIAIVLFIFHHSHERIGLANVVVIFTSGIIAYLCALGIKTAIARPRPDLVLEHVNELATYASAFGAFPSGHATLFMALAAAVFCFHKRVGALLFTIAIIISLARVFAGVHWITDVVAGAALGITTAWVVYCGARHLGLLGQRPRLQSTDFHS